MNPFDAVPTFISRVIPGFELNYHQLSTWMIGSFIALVSCYLFAGIDDVLVDIVAWWKNIKPRELNKVDLYEIAAIPQRNIAIIIPAWEEGGIIGRMLLGNLERIEYTNYHIFVGCYPNDQDTVDAVEAIGAGNGRIHAIVNFKDGPTSKGQILNWVVDSILDWESVHDVRFDAFLMHDSEDLIHPKSLLLLNSELKRADFIQIPVFSLELSPSALVAGIYIDEFAEAHTKDVLVRAHLGGCVPSAGVGTCMSRSFVVEQLRSNNGRLFNDSCLTEDYELGIHSGLGGARQAFVSAFYRDDASGKKEFIATREYFPKGFRRSVRQKTRWTMGIALQCWRNIGWRGSFMQRYFLFRDRKGLFTNPLMFLGYIWTVVFALVTFFLPFASADFDVGRFAKVGGITGLFAINRLAQRMIAVGRVYGWRSVITVPIRLPVGNVINAFAVFNSIYKDIKCKITKKNVAWAKTSHELPVHFGVIPSSTTAEDSMQSAVRGGS